MHEIIHISLSAQANHLTSHFYNAQGSYFVFDDSQINTTSFVDPNGLFRLGLGTDNRTRTFTPRSLIWDMRGGFGALKKSNPLYNYDNHASTAEINVWNQRSAPSSRPNEDTSSDGIVQLKENRVEISDYQKALDAGNPSSSLLNTSNTRYWSDYINMYFKPRLSFHTLPDWEYDPLNAPLGQPRGSNAGPEARKFVSYETGVEEYRVVNALGDDSTYIEDTLRPLIEECDSISGLNFFTEMDTAWGSFTAKVIEEFREDYVTKSPIFVYAICDNELTADKYSFDSRGRLLNRLVNTTNSGKEKETKQQAVSRIKTLTSLASSASLVIPISKPKNVSKQLKNYDPYSLWHSGALLSLPVETMSVLSNLRENKRIPMQQILDALQNGSNRNIVSNIESTIVRPKKNDSNDKQAMSLETLLGKKDTSNQTELKFTGSLFDGLDGSKKEKYFSKIGTLRRDYGEMLENSSLEAQTNAAILEYKRLMMSGSKANTGPGTTGSVDKSVTEIFDSLFDQRKMQDDGTSEAALHRFSCPQPLATPMSFPCSALEIQDYSASQYLPKNEREKLDRPDAIYASMGITTKPRAYLKSYEKTISRFTRQADDGIDELKEDTAALAELYEWEWEEDDEFFEDD